MSLFRICLTRTLHATDIYTKAVLTVIAIMLSALALKPFIQTQPAKAASRFQVREVSGTKEIPGKPGSFYYSDVQSIRTELDSRGDLKAAVLTNGPKDILGWHGILICGGTAVQK